jgi:cytochrome c553
MKSTIVPAVLIGTCLTILSAAAQLNEEERFAPSARCVACHGVVGIAENPTFPHLAGQNAAYLEMQLERFRSGQRYDPLMTPIAQSLAAEELPALARYFESLRGFPAPPSSGDATEATAVRAGVR